MSAPVRFTSDRNECLSNQLSAGVVFIGVAKYAQSVTGEINLFQLIQIITFLAVPLPSMVDVGGDTKKSRSYS